MATDGDTGTAWVEGKVGLGQGEWIRFEFDKPQELRLLCVVNGYALTWDLYNKNPRVRSFTLATSEENIVGDTLSDNATEDRFAYFQEVRGVEALPASRTLTLTITGLYAGTGRQRYSDSSISEVEFWVEQSHPAFRRVRGSYCPPCFLPGWFQSDGQLLSFARQGLEHRWLSRSRSRVAAVSLA